MELFVNEFFGHERGAYTGAESRSQGLIARADGGTLVLDEINSLPMEGQTALLRFLDDREYHRIGGGTSLRADLRIIAVTNEDLASLVAKKLFREDLYHRLKVVELITPPLRERTGDIELLAHHFLGRLAHDHDRTVYGFAEGCVEKLERYHWPGNVRELRDVMESAVVNCPGEVLTVDQLGELGVPAEAEPPSRAGQSFKAGKARAVNEFERRYLSAVMREARGNISEAARMARMTPGAMHHLLKKHQMLPVLGSRIVAATTGFLSVFSSAV